jgi:hypothetical protein
MKSTIRWPEVEPTEELYGEVDYLLQHYPKSTSFRLNNDVHATRIGGRENHSTRTRWIFQVRPE